MNNKIKKLSIYGAIFAVFFGSILHFIYNWSDDNFVVGMFAPVNESVWEHMKLVFAPLIIFAIFEAIYYTNEVKNFFLGHIISQIVPILFIILFFYIYNLFLPENLALDIISFIIGICIGKYLNYIIITRKYSFKYSETISILALILLSLIFVKATLNPPRINLFLDPVSNTYGIYKYQ